MRSWTTIMCLVGLSLRGCTVPSGSPAPLCCGSGVWGCVSWGGGPGVGRSGLCGASCRNDHGTNQGPGARNDPHRRAATPPSTKGCRPQTGTGAGFGNGTSAATDFGVGLALAQALSVVFRFPNYCESGWALYILAPNYPKSIQNYLQSIPNYPQTIQNCPQTISSEDRPPRRKKEERPRSDRAAPHRLGQRRMQARSSNAIRQTRSRGPRAANPGPQPAPSPIL